MPLKPPLKFTDPHAFKAQADGSMVIYLETETECVEITIPAHTVPRMMYSAIDALKGKDSVR